MFRDNIWGGLDEGPPAAATGALRTGSLSGWLSL